MMSLVSGGTSTQPMLRPTPARQVGELGDCGEASCSSRAAAERLGLAARDQHQELVAAPAEHVVRLADVAQQERGDFAQHAVAGLVAERVVDHLEAIDVDEDDRQRRLVAAMPLQLAADDFVEEPPVAACRSARR